MSSDSIPFLEASFSTCPPVALDVIGENFPLAGYLVDTFSVVSSLDA